MQGAPHLQRYHLADRMRALIRKENPSEKISAMDKSKCCSRASYKVLRFADTAQSHGVCSNWIVISSMDKTRSRRLDGLCTTRQFSQTVREKCFRYVTIMALIWGTYCSKAPVY